MSKDRDGICVAAYESGVPVFVPSYCDSGMGFSLMFSNRRRKRHIIVDHMRDVDESSRITEKSNHTSVIVVGGGVPKNFIQQTAVIASYQTRHDRTHDFAIQFTTDVPQWGGLSGSTFEEAQSWGKYNPHAKMVQCFVDATIALPVVTQALSQRFKRFRRRVPKFNWSEHGNNLSIQFQPSKALAILVGNSKSAVRVFPSNIIACYSARTAFYARVIRNCDLVLLPFVDVSRADSDASEVEWTFEAHVWILDP